MTRMFLGVIAGFIAWAILWVGGEKVLSIVSPDWFGSQHQAFQAAVENGGAFNPDTAFLLTQVVCASIVSVIAGFLAAMVSGENKHAPLVLGVALLAMGIPKAAMSWAYVPIWYHVIFTAILIPMTIVGGRLKTVKS